MKNYTNDLINETSPYLLQHAENPVNWIPWSKDIFDIATRENKLVLFSIGYSACHWCHVMEKECFQDEEVAELMNKFFINVKVDREERPDIDQVYMTAVQLMTHRGGWPLNCFTLPDGKPIYGGTYFPKDQWIYILKSLKNIYDNDYDKVVNYAEGLCQEVVDSELISVKAKCSKFKCSHLDKLVDNWSTSFDFIHGGETKAPKFMLPSNFSFLLDYAINSENQKIMSYVQLTLDKIVYGGIYDQIGGGFSRYSVDIYWKVPHFEKMLYDNGQLLSLYSQGYKCFKTPLYKRIIYQTVEWIEREMLNENGSFYCAIDADSEGVEGKFYVWRESELKSILKDDFSWFSDFYQISKDGNWEEGNNILFRKESDSEFMNKMGWSLEKLETNMKRINKKLLLYRNKRISPSIDDKCLTSWNAIALKGLCDAYTIFKEDRFLSLALDNANWIIKKQLRVDGGLWRNYKNGRSNIQGFLEDYAHVISAFISLYESTLNEEWLDRSNNLIKYVIKHFYDEKSGMFFFTQDDTPLIARKMEVTDNVIPSSNSVMARNLYYISKYYNNCHYEKISKQMLSNIYNGIEMKGSVYSNWAILLNHFIYGLNEFVIIGKNAEEKYNEIKSRKNAISLFACSISKSKLPIFDNKSLQEEALIYLCKNNSCLISTKKVEDVC